jgi:hypothetical protein
MTTPKVEKSALEKNAEEGAVSVGLSEDEVSLNDQCVLLEMAQKIYKFAKGSDCGDQFGIPGTCPDLDSPLLSLDWLKAYKINYDYIKHITLSSRSTSFLEITPDEVAQITPRIAIAIAFYNKNGKRVRTQPLDFPNETDLKKSAFTQTGQRLGAGIRDITITHEGIDTATDKIVLINSTFVFQDFRTVASGTYSELLKLGIKGKDTGERRYIRFEFGWDGPPHLSKKLGLPSMLTSVRGELIKYTFDFAEDGSIILKTQHRGTIHSVFGNNPANNILSINKEAQENLKASSVTIIAASRKEIKANNVQAKASNAIQDLAMNVVLQQLSAYAVGGQHTGAFKKGLGGALKGKMTFNAHITDTLVSSALKYAGVETSTLGSNALAEIQAVAQREMRRVMQLGYGGGATDLHVGKRRRQVLSDLPIDPTSRHPGPTGSIWIEANEVNYRELSAMIQAVEGKQKVADSQKDLVKNNLKARTILATARAEYARQVGLLRFLGLFRLTTALGKKQKIYYGALNEEQHMDIIAGTTHQPTLLKVFNRITAESFFTTAQPIVEASMAARKNVDTAKKAASVAPWVGRVMKSATTMAATLPGNALSSGTATIVPFVFFGEFLETILKMPTSDDGGQPLHQLMKDVSGVDILTVLGYVNYDGPFTNTKINRLPLYYFPISLKKLNNFVARELVAKDRIYYSFGQLIKDLIQKLIEGSFFVCKREADTGYQPATPKIDYAFGKIGEREIFFIYDSKTFVNDMKGKHFGKYKRHLEAKIPHFYLGGPNKGIAKKITLKDIADPTLKTAVFYKPSPTDTGIPPGGGSTNDAGGNEDPSRGRWAPVVFETEVECLGYPNFQLGQLLFMDVRRFINASISNDFLATGYYGIKKIEHKLTKDSFTTTASAIIQVSEKDKERLSKISDGAEAIAAGADPTIDPNALALANATGIDPETARVMEEVFNAEHPGTAHTAADEEGSELGFANISATAAEFLEGLAAQANAKTSAQSESTMGLVEVGATVGDLQRDIESAPAAVLRQWVPGDHQNDDVDATIKRTEAFKAQISALGAQGRVASVTGLSVSATPGGALIDYFF